MKYLMVLAIPSLLTAANPLLPRQEAQPAADAQKLLALRANHCLDKGKPECRDALRMCQGGSKPTPECIRDEHPACIQDETSPCSTAVWQCLVDFGDNKDADQAVNECITNKMPVWPATNDNHTNQPTEAGIEQLSPCQQVSLEYQVAMFQHDCYGGNDVDKSRGEAPESKPLACKMAQDTFQQAWTANNCDAKLYASQ